MIDQNTLKKLLPDVIDIAQQAGDALLPFYQKIAPHQIKEKVDQTPVTEADHAAHEIIDTKLSLLTPNWPVLSEEGECPDFSERKQWGAYWLVDPLDGTRGFINHSKEFTVNIALIDHGQPVMGVIVQPVTDDCFYAMTDGGGFHLKRGQSECMICPSPAKNDLVRVLTGRFDKSVPVVEKIFARPDIELIKMNSSVKFAALAQGLGDIYCRLGKTSEWDTAAGQCILTAVGGAVVDFEGQPLQYNTKSSLINPPFLAVRDASQLGAYLEMIQKYL